MKKKVIDWKLLGICFAVVFLCALIGSLFTRIDSWYYSIKPAITPPSFVFPIVWTILFIMIALSFYYSLKSLKNLKIKTKNKIKRIRGFVWFLFIFNMLLNALWTIIFFTFRNPHLAFNEMMLLETSIIFMIFYLWHIDKKASLLLIPYAIWVGFASYITYVIAFG